MRYTRFAAMVLTLAVLVLLGGCGQRAPAGAEIDLLEAAETILDGVEFENQLIQATGEAVRSYYRLGDKVDEHAIFIDGSGGSAEEVAVLRAVDEDSVDAVLAVVEDRLDDLAGRFQDYQPREMTKIGDPVIVTRGRTVILVICNDPAQAEDVVAGLF